MELILGKSKTGKSKYIYEAIEKHKKEGAEVILFVPSQMRALTEKNYIQETNTAGLIGVNITTIDTYVTQKVKEYNFHLEEKYVSKCDKKIVLTQVIAENKKLGNVFKKVKNKEGFIELLAIYMDLFRRGNIAIEEIQALELSNKVLEYKIKEIAKIYALYETKLKERFVDAKDEMEFFLSQICAQKQKYQSLHIYFDGYNNFTAMEYTFLRSLIQMEVPIHISITTDATCIQDVIAGETSDIFEVSNQTYQRLLKIANEEKSFVDTKLLYLQHSRAEKDLAFLADHIFQEENITPIKMEHMQVRIENNVYSEIERIASVITQKITEGYRYQDFCMYTTDIESYESIIQRIFYEYHIPVYQDSAVVLESSKLTKYIENLLEISTQGMNAEVLLETLKLGLNRITPYEVALLENYMLEFQISPYRFTKPFRYHNTQSTEITYDLELLNDIREKIIQIFMPFKEKIKAKKQAREMVTIIYEHLVSESVFEQYAQYITLLQEKEESSILKRYDVEQQVWEKIGSILDAIVKVYDTEGMTVSDFSRIFKMVCKDTKIKSVPSTKDQVLLVDINGSKVEMRKQVFFIGVTENEFPRKVQEDILFSDLELRQLEEHDMRIKENSLSKYNMGLYNIYKALGQIKEQLYISIPAADFSGKSLRMSSFIMQMQKIVQFEIQGDVTKEEDTLIYSEEMAFENMTRALEKWEDLKEDTTDQEHIKKAIREEILAYYLYFREQKQFQTLLTYKKEDNALNKETIEMLYPATFDSSITKLELFRKCPFSYFMQYVLQIKPRKEFEVSSLDIGNFMHHVVEAFSFYLLEHQIQWPMILKLGKTLEDVYESVLENLIEKELERSLGKQKESVKYAILKQKLQNTMKKVMIVIALGFNQSEFTPYGYEIEFREGKLFAPIKIRVDETHVMYLIGKIDRVDILQQEQALYVRVVDYKSSARPLSLEEIKEGLSLQLVTYITSFMNHMKQKEYEHVIPAGMLYFNLSDHLLTLKEYSKQDDVIEKEILKTLRMKGIFLQDLQIIEKMDHKLSDTNKRLIDIAASTLKPGKNSTKALAEADFESLCKEAEQILQKIGEEMVSGVVKIRPHKKANHCQYCSYQPICRKTIPL